MLALLAALPVAHAPEDALVPVLAARSVPAKPTHTVLPPGEAPRQLVVKFAEGTAVRLREGRFVSLGDDDLRGLHAVMAQLPAETTPARMFSRPEAELAADKARIEAKSSRVQADKNLYYRLFVPDAVGAADVTEVLDALNALDVVEIAYPEPRPVVLATSTPDYVAQQGYRGARPVGIDTEYAATVPGGRGHHVTIIDVEYDWNTAHEDLTRTVEKLIPNGNPSPPPNDQEHERNHGTAVLGVLVGDANAFGVTGIADRAGIGMVNAFKSPGGSDVPGAIDLAHDNLGPGDVIVIEVAPDTEGCQCGAVPMEWDQASYDAIVSATSDRVIVVEGAGNASEDLDDTSKYGTPFPAGRPDSGAIIVGAGNAPGCTSPPRGRIVAPQWGSTYGSRVDLQGWGECVVTSGYGDLSGKGTICPDTTTFEGCDPNRWYTDTFGGTSSAAAIVAGAAANLSSVAKARGITLTPRQVRSLLVSTGTAQDTSAAAHPGHVGPLPDLRAAITAFEQQYVVPGAPTGVTASAGNASAQVTWSPPADRGGSPITGYTVVAAPGGTTTTVDGDQTTATVTGLANGTAYTFTVAATNTAGRGPPSAPSNSVTPASTTIATTTGLVSSPDPSTYGQAVTLTATVTSSTGDPPTGTVTFTDGAATLGTRALASGQASLTTVALAAGAHTLTAAYNGDAGHAPSSGSTSHTVNRAPTAVSLSSSPNPSQHGQTVTLTATVTSDDGLPTGTVSFADGSTTLATRALDTSGRASFTTSSLAAGTRALAAAYGGDANYSPSSGSSTHTVDGVSTTTTPSTTPTTTATTTTTPATTTNTTTTTATTTTTTTTTTATSVPRPPEESSADPHGYWLTATDGGIFAFGNAGYFGSTGDVRLSSPVVAMAPTPSGRGYWVAAADGGVFAFGDARFFGSTGAVRLAQPIVGMAAAPNGDGYWLVAADGGIFAFGPGANFFGSTGAVRLAQPIVGMAAAPNGDGYWLVAADGGIFAFGPGASFFGSTGAVRLAQPIVGMAATPKGDGYWLVAADGGIFAFGDAGFFGSTGGVRLAQPIVDMATTPTRLGYWLVAADGGIFAFGDAGFFGSTGGMRLNQPIADLAPA